MVQQGLSTVVTGANIYAVRIKNRCNIVGMHTLDGEGDDALVLLPLIGADNMHALYFLHALKGDFSQRRFAGFYRLKAHALNIVDSRMQAHGSRRIDSASLELVGQGCIFLSFATHPINHLAAV